MNNNIPIYPNIIESLTKDSIMLLTYVRIKNKKDGKYYLLKVTHFNDKLENNIPYKINNSRIMFYDNIKSTYENAEVDENSSLFTLDKNQNN